MRIIIEFDEQRPSAPQQPEVRMEPAKMAMDAQAMPQAPEAVETIDAGAANPALMTDVDGVPNDLLEAAAPGQIQEGESAGSAPDLPAEMEMPAGDGATTAS